MEDPVLAALGIALVAVAMLDLAWTVLAVSSGRGPLRDTLARLIWRSLRGARHHRAHRSCERVSRRAF